MPDQTFNFETLHVAVRERLPDLDSDLVVSFMALSRLSRLIERDTTQLLRADRLESSEHTVMTALWLSGHDRPLSPAQLSQSIVQTPSGMTKTIRRLERAGLVERTPDSIGARRQFVRLTPAGVAMAERHYRAQLELWGDRLKSCTTSDGPLGEVLWPLLDSAPASVTERGGVRSGGRTFGREGPEFGRVAG